MEAPVETTSLEKAPCGFVAFDDHGMIVEINARLAGWLDHDRSALLGTPVTDIFSKANRIIFELSMLPVLKMSKKIDGVSLDLVRYDGTKLPVLLSGERHETDTRAVTSLVILNAGGRRTYEREIAEARAVAEAELVTKAREGKLREQFVAILGHDLRNPLAALHATIRVLAQSATDELDRSIAAQAVGSVQRMSRLIDTSLDFARLRLGAGFDLDLSDAARLGSQIELVVQELVAANPEREIKLLMDLQHQPACDILRIGQLVSNLLANALFHGDRDQPVFARVVGDEQALTISVINKGKPISPEIMERLFHPYEKSKTNSQHGLGLGLYIVSEIAKAHGGEMTVRSEGQSTEFTFRMPCESDVLTG